MPGQSPNPSPSGVQPSPCPPPEGPQHLRTSNFALRTSPLVSIIRSFAIRTFIRHSNFVLRISLLAVLPACQTLNLGPLPDTYIGPMSPVTPPPVALPLEDPAAATQPGAATSPATRTAALAASKDPLQLSLQEAILLTLENNPALRVQRANPLISRTTVERLRAVYDPAVSGSISGGRTGRPLSPDSSSPTNETDSIAADAAISQFLPTGTTLSANGSVNYSTSSYYDDSTLVSTRAGLTITQSLLQGASVAANLADIRQAQLDVRASQYELRGFAENLLATVETTYWDYALATRQIAIFEASLKLAQDQLEEINERIRVGGLAEIERAAAEAEVAVRRESLINASAARERLRLQLLRLIAPRIPASSQYWHRDIQLADLPFTPTLKLEDVDAHVAIALLMRPDLNQARLLIQRGELEIIQTKNGLLPRLDLFLTLGKTGYAQSLGGSITDLDGPAYEAVLGLRGDYTLGNRAARADHRRAVLSKEQAHESLENLITLAQVDVRSAFIEVRRAQAQIEATRATRIAREATLAAEQGKFRVGRSTALLVAQAQRDLVQAQINEVLALTNALKAITNLYNQEGSLLERRYIAAPGRTPTTETPAIK